MEIITKTLLNTISNGRVLTLYIQEENGGKIHCLNVPLDKLDDDVVVLNKKEESAEDWAKRVVNYELILKLGRSTNGQADVIAKSIYNVVNNSSMK